jgi:hypothetical protein
MKTISQAITSRTTYLMFGAFALLMTGLAVEPARAQTQITDPETIAKILKGFQISPVPINMQGKDPNLVGYGSYLVNAAGSCNDCHSAGATTEYVAPGIPYFGQQPTKVNPAVYLGGGDDFGAFPSSTGNFPHIISRNLTPDSSGLPFGGDTLQQFMQIIRTGVDLDHVHPTCTGAPDGKCIPAPFDGNLLQIMPWPILQNLSDFDLQAIYEYVSTIPCLEGGPNEPANRCGTTGTQTVAIAGPKNATVSAHQFQLDGTKSISFDGKPLTYVWTIPKGSPQAAILGGTTATPTVQFGNSPDIYMFLLTVTDSTGKSASDVATINFVGN